MHLPAPLGNSSRSLATYLTTSGAVFVAPGAPTSTPAPTAGVSTQSETAPHSSRSNIPTTIRPLLLARLLHDHFNTQFVSTLITRLCHGFDLGYQGPHRGIRSPNLPFAAAHPQEVSDCLQKECAVGCMASPFSQPPFLHLLGLHWQGQFYHDKCLPFDLGSSPFLFNTLASALEYIFRNQLNNPNIIHYLDDFLIAGSPCTSICLSRYLLRHGSAL